MPFLLDSSRLCTSEWSCTFSGCPRALISTDSYNTDILAAGAASPTFRTRTPKVKRGRGIMLALSKESQVSESEPPALSPRVSRAALLGSESQAGSVAAVPPPRGARSQAQSVRTRWRHQDSRMPPPLEQPLGAMWSEGLLPAPGAAV